MSNNEECIQGADILLVEDDDVLCDLIRRNLLAHQHRVSIAEDAHEALELLQTQSFDLTVLDINLPDKTGWDILRIAKREGWLHLQTFSNGEQKLPVVVLSATRVSSQRLAEFCPLAYLPKPFPMDAVLRFAREAADRKKQSIGFRRAASHLFASPPS